MGNLLDLPTLETLAGLISSVSGPGLVDKVTLLGLSLTEDLALEAGEESSTGIVVGQ